MAEISINNGLTFCSASEVIAEIMVNGLWDNVVERMDDELRERVHDELAPCSELEFLARYLELAENDFIPF